ncbi:MAG: glycoside hydrolase family 127 protein, partial [Clostridia bacterium]|nr:glycoside hydrolase family 127 protein [Clostridia bacterium]
MRDQFYLPNTANYPRLKTDTFFVDEANRYKYTGFVEGAIRYIEEFQLLRPDLWNRFVMQFRADSDFNAGWKGEYWGKMMRGACFNYAYTRDQELYDTLTQTVSDMIDSQDPDGRISSYGRNHEFDGWDMWSRKYVLLGMQYFLEICTDAAFSKRIVESMCGQADYIIAHIGDEEEGKKPINSATRNWRGLNSSSILEPFVRLYTITGEQRYFDFATYIVENGGTDVENIFELALQDELYPYQYPVTKAYEMTSCFEGLLEYYRVTGVEKYRTAVINFANRILESDFTIIGCCGCTHELFDHSTVRQANTQNGKIAQETCVTV